MCQRTRSTTGCASRRGKAIRRSSSSARWAPTESWPMKCPSALVSGLPQSCSRAAIASVWSPGYRRAAASRVRIVCSQRSTPGPFCWPSADLPGKQWKERRQQARLRQHAEASRRLRHRQHLAQLLADPLWRDRGGMRGSRAQGRQRGRFDLEVELGRQPHGTQQAKGVLVEALGRDRRPREGPAPPGRRGHRRDRPARGRVRRHRLDETGATPSARRP